MTSHRGRRRIPLPSLPKPALVKPALAAGALTTVIAGCVIGVTVTRQDPVSVVPVGSISPLHSPTPPVRFTPPVRPVRVCTVDALGVRWCDEQGARAVVDGSAVTR